MSRAQRCRNLKANGDHYDERLSKRKARIAKRARVRYFRRDGIRQVHAQEER